MTGPEVIGGAMNWIAIGMSAVCLLICILTVRMHVRQRRAFERSTVGLRTEMRRKHDECLHLVHHIAENMEAAERTAQASAELLGDGRLAMPTRARALQMLRSGMAADTAAVELGLARSDVRLLAKVGSLLATGSQAKVNVRSAPHMQANPRATSPTTDARSAVPASAHKPESMARAESR